MNFLNVVRDDVMFNYVENDIVLVSFGDKVEIFILTGIFAEIYMLSFSEEAYKLEEYIAEYPYLEKYIGEFQAFIELKSLAEKVTKEEFEPSYFEELPDIVASLEKYDLNPKLIIGEIRTDNSFEDLELYDDFAGEIEVFAHTY